MDPLQISLIPMAGVTIDVDGSLPIQVGIMLLLMFLLKQLIFDPYLRSVEAREAKTGAARRDATRIRAQAEELAARYEAGIEQARSGALSARQDLRVDGLALRDRSVKDARGAANASLDETCEEVEVALAAVQGELAEHARALSGRVVERVLGRGV